jgi:quercetin dioxygenase-like cupin family protein
VEYAKGRLDGQPSRAGDEGTFTGQAMLDPLLDDGAAAKVRVNSVIFQPGGRTHWHSHTDGQVLLVGSGRGVVENRDGDRHVLHAGDLVWAPPGEQHWHGAAPDSFLAHTAVSLGLTQWHEAVSDEQYESAFSEE